MNNNFDELAKGLAQCVTRRGALKRFGAGLAGAVVTCLGLANRAEAQGCKCQQWKCVAGEFSPAQYFYLCGNKKPPLSGSPGDVCYDLGLVDSSYCR